MISYDYSYDTTMIYSFYSYSFYLLLANVVPRKIREPRGKYILFEIAAEKFKKAIQK